MSSITLSRRFTALHPDYSTKKVREDMKNQKIIGGGSEVSENLKELCLKNSVKLTTKTGKKRSKKTLERMCGKKK